MKTISFDMNDDQAQIQVANNPKLHDDEMIQRDEFREAVKKRVREDSSLPFKLTGLRRYNCVFLVSHFQSSAE